MSAPEASSLQVVNNFVEVQHLPELLRGRGGWAYGLYPGLLGDAAPSWHIHLCGSRKAHERAIHDDVLAATPGMEPLHELWTQIKDNLAQDYGLVRAYVTGHTHGQDGVAHHTTPSRRIRSVSPCSTPAPNGRTTGPAKPCSTTPRASASRSARVLADWCCSTAPSPVPRVPRHGSARHCARPSPATCGASVAETDAVGNSTMLSAYRHCLLATTVLLLLCGMAPCIASARGFGGTHADLGEPLQIPIADPDGHTWTLQGRLCRPAGVSRPRVVVIAHGSPAKASDRPGMTLETCDGESARWFLRHHYAVALVLRLGYGATGGPWSEGYDGCDHADYVKAGLETARQLKRIVDALTTLPDYSPTGAIVVGQSAGGWGTLAYESLPHPNVSAFVNMAGGRGGHFHDRPNSNCHADRLIAAAATFGRQATTPMLWIYTANDSFFGPDLAASLHRAFTEAGGHAVLVTPAAFGDDGHHLFFGHGGSAIWGPAVDRYLGSVDAPASP